MDEQYKEVRFDIYCSTCQYELLEDSEDPCCECLSIFARQNSAKPEFYKKDPKKESENG